MYFVVTSLDNMKHHGGNTAFVFMYNQMESEVLYTYRSWHTTVYYVWCLDGKYRISSKHTHIEGLWWSQEL